MRLLVWADAQCHSGFAQVTHNLFEKLVTKHGHDVSVLGINARGDYWDTPLKVYRADMLDPKDIYGANRIVELMSKVMPDAIVMLNDQSVTLNLLLDNKHDPERVLWRGMRVGDFAYKPPIIGYLTADGYESPRSWGTLAERVTRVAMSHFGQQQMPEAPVIWHGVDTSIYHPQDRREAKRKLGYDPDRFLILRTDKNSTRKDYPSTWKALRPVLRRHPDIDVHFHCLPRTGECDLRAAMWNDEDIRDRVNFSPNLGGYTGWDEESCDSDGGGGPARLDQLGRRVRTQPVAESRLRHARHRAGLLRHHRGRGSGRHPHQASGTHHRSTGSGAMPARHREVQLLDRAPLRSPQGPRAAG